MSFVLKINPVGIINWVVIPHGVLFWQSICVNTLNSIVQKTRISKSFTASRWYFFLLVFISYNFVLGQTQIGQFKAIGEIQNVGDQVFFIANDGNYGDELWVTQVTDKNPVMVKDINSGFYGSSISHLTSFKGDLYFAANDNINGMELWKSDGTLNGTKMLMNINDQPQVHSGWSSPNLFTVFNDELYFTANDGGSTQDLWKTDGTELGTVKVLEIDSYSGIIDLLVDGDFLFIKSGLATLSKLEGSTDLVTILSIDDNYPYMDKIHLFNNSLVCIKYTTNYQKIRLYLIDPLTDQYTLLKEFSAPPYGSQEIDNFTTVNETLFFSLRTDLNYDQDTDVLWKSNGTANGTVVVKSFNWDRHWSNSHMQNFISYNNNLFFRSGGTIYGNPLYISDGSNEGTKLLNEISVNHEIKPILSNGKFYFAGGVKTIWESDGTTTGTRAKFSTITLTTHTDVTIFHDVNGVIYFKGSDQYGLSLWNSIPNSEIEVKQGYKTLKNNEELLFESKVDSCSSYPFEIVNAGERELAISKIFVTGNDFYLKGELNQLVNPGESISFSLFHFPFSERETKSFLEIHSNDENEGVFRLNLTSVAEGSTGTINSGCKDLQSELIPMDGHNSSILQLDNSVIVENSEANSSVGFFIIEGQDIFDVSLVGGIGDRDNSLFTIHDRELIALESFDYETSSSLTIRVKGVLNSTSESVERPFIIEVKNLNEDLTYSECEEININLSYALNDVQYIGHNTIIAIGQSGIIMKSVDDGINWRQINSGTKGSLHNVQFTDDLVGYIVGADGILLKTENAGEDWFRINYPDKNYPYSNRLYFHDKNRGYLFGSYGDVFITEDGGISWKGKNIGGYENLVAVDFVNEQIGFFCGRSNTLMKTENGGDSWSTIDLHDLGWNIHFIDIQFVNESIGFMAGGKGEIYKTSDIGETWVQVGSFPTDYATDIHFINETIGYATGGWISSNIFKTEDGGVTWTAQKQGSYYQNTIAFDFNPDNTKACAVGYGSSIGSTGENGRTIFTMSNDVWTLNSSLEQAYYFSTNYVNETTAFLFGERNFKTTNGGLTWNRMDVQNTENIIGSFFLDSNNGYAIDRNEIYKTIDGGDTWSKIDSQIEDATSMRSIYFFDKNMGFVFGWGDAIYKTTDEGDTWEKISGVTNSTAIEDMVFLDANNGFAVSGNPAKILKTENGGLSWTPLNSHELKWLNAIYFFDNTHGIAVGNDGFELLTNDGGESWTEVQTTVRTDFVSIYFLNSTKGYAACTNRSGIGEIYKTLDGGASWLLVTQLDELQGVAGFGSNLMFVGESGTLVSITNRNAPTIPGHISGLSTATVNSAFNYSVLPSSNTEYRWEVDGNNVIEYSQHQAIITWNELGTHTVRVTPYNSCGEGLSRMTLIDVEGVPSPSILGADTVNARSSEVYTAHQQSAKSRLSWKVEGAHDYQVGDESINIEWGNVLLGDIELLETNNSGARGRARMSVYIIMEEITGLDIENLFPEFDVYPNPSSDFLNVDLGNSIRTSAKVRILDISGRELKTKEIDYNQNISIDVRGLSSGVYLLEISTSKYKRTTRVIKK